MLYTRKINPIFSDIQNRIFDFEIAALDVMNFEWSYIFPRLRINLPFVVSFIFLEILKRYPEPMAHGPAACEPSHPLWPMARRPVSHHTRAEAVDTGCQRSIPVL